MKLSELIKEFGSLIYIYIYVYIYIYIHIYIYKSNFLVTINNSLKVTGKIDFMNDSNKIKYPRINLILMM
jgi:hypothetical protein